MPFITLFNEARDHWEKQTWGLWNFFPLCCRVCIHFSFLLPLCELKEQGSSLPFNRGLLGTVMASSMSPIFTVLLSPAVWWAAWRGNPPAAGTSHVVRHIYGVQLVGQESISEVHALLLPSGVNGDDTRVHHHHHPYDEVVLLQDNIGDQGHQVQGFLLWSLQLHNHHKEVGPCEHSAEERRRWMHGDKWEKEGEMMTAEEKEVSRGWKTEVSSQNPCCLAALWI